ncbi:MAG: LamG-like jellyroll fold domain-containing protein [Pirellulaceae bacterium]
MKKRLWHSLACPMVCLAWCAASANEPAVGNRPVEVTFSESATIVDVYDFVEVTINVPQPTTANPFTDAVVAGEFRCGEGEPLKVDGFCDAQDGSVFRVRLMPTKPGLHRYSVTYRQGDFEVSHAGTITARAADRRGLVRVDSEHPWHFLWEGTGEHYFWNGTTTYWLMGWDDETIRSSLDRLHRLKVNRVRVVIMGRVQDGRAWAEHVYPTDKFTFLLHPWVAARPDSVENPGFDVTRFNVAHWQKYDRLLRHARDLDMVVSVIFYVDGARPGTDPFGKSGMGGEDEQRYYRYAVARCAPFSNVMWDVTNEYHLFRDEAWVNKMGTLIRQWDPYDHLASVHGHGEFPFRTSQWADFAMHQQWDEGGGYAFMRACRDKQHETGRIMPQVNEEYGYEDHYPRWGGDRKWPARTADNRRRLAWSMVMAGGYQTTGERADTGTGWGADTGGGWINGRGDNSMVMLQGYAHMVDFFTRIAWWTLNPDDGLFVVSDRSTLPTQLTHVLYTRDKQGVAAMYVGGQPVATRKTSGDVSSWDARFGFALANELTNDRPWLGDYHAIALYDTALTGKDVADRFQAGVAATQPRPPLLHYTFREGSGDVVRDVSGMGEPLNLKVDTTDAVHWLPEGGLRIASPTRIASEGAADKIAQAISRSGELTLEAWVKPANMTQSGPARIVTFSADTSRRNFTLGQAGGEYEVRFRTTATSPNGEPSLWSSSQDAHAGPPFSALRSATGDLAVVYFASGGQVTLDPSKLADPVSVEWYNPRDGRSQPAKSIQLNTYRAPDGEDWVLLLRKS